MPVHSCKLVILTGLKPISQAALDLQTQSLPLTTWNRAATHQHQSETPRKAFWLAELESCANSWTNHCGQDNEILRLAQLNSRCPSIFRDGFLLTHKVGVGRKVLTKMGNVFWANRTVNVGRREEGGFPLLQMVVERYFFELDWSSEIACSDYVKSHNENNKIGFPVFYLTLLCKWGHGILETKASQGKAPFEIERWPGVCWMEKWKEGNKTSGGEAALKRAWGGGMMSLCWRRVDGSRRKRSGSELEARLQEALSAEWRRLGFRLWETGGHVKVLSRGWCSQSCGCSKILQSLHLEDRQAGNKRQGAKDEAVPIQYVFKAVSEEGDRTPGSALLLVSFSPSHAQTLIRLDPSLRSATSQLCDIG